jgi:hypothetical protein
MDFWQWVDSIWVSITSIPLDGLGKLIGLICLGTVLAFISIFVFAIFKVGLVSGGSCAESAVKAIGQFIILLVVVGAIGLAVWGWFKPQDVVVSIPIAPTLESIFVHTLQIIITDIPNEQPVSTESTPIPETNSPNNVCWNLEVKNFYGNRSEAWNKFLNYKMRKLIPFDQFKKDVTLHNPHLQDDGYIFFNNKVYILPQLCP